MDSALAQLSGGMPERLSWTDKKVENCFIIEANDSKYTPTLVEAMILADQIKKGNSLPPANNEH